MEFAIDLGGAALLAVAFVLAVIVAARLHAGPATRSEDLWTSMERMALAIRPHPAAIVVSLCVAALTLIGALAVILDIDWRPVRINQEQSFASYFSSLLLFSAAALAIVLGRRGGPNALAWTALGLSFAAIGIDEAGELHERIEVRTGVPSFIAVAPVVAVAAISWWRVLPQMRSCQTALSLFFAGVAAWFTSQALDPFHAAWKSVVEETLEMCGSALILVGLVYLLRSIAAEVRSSALSRGVFPHSRPNG
jgi:hypothetical protein